MNAVRNDGLRDVLLLRFRMVDGAEFRDFGEPLGHPISADETRLLSFRGLLNCCVGI